MTFRELLAHVIAWLHQDKRVSYRALKMQFDLDDATLEALKEELLYAHPVVDDAGRGLIWTSDPAPHAPDARRGPEAESRFHMLLRAVMGLLQRERRVTYRELKHIFVLNDPLVEEIREELTFKQLARDEDGKGLVWTGEAQPAVQREAAIPSFPANADTPAVVASPMTPTLPPPVTETRTASKGPTGPTQAISTEAPQDKPVALEPARSISEAERRQLTVMFCDLADSTKLSQQIDPEDLREIVRAYQATAAKVIQQYEGHIAQYLGDGLLVYFGWPVAHEDDAPRAAHAGLGIVEAITTHLNPRLEAEKGVQLTVRLGIHTGPVVVGEMGGGGRHENLATGETVNIAARLEGLAAPDTVVISSATERLMRDAFNLEPLGPQVLKGVAEPMHVFRVLHPMQDRDDETATVGVPFLVGRDEEVGLLLRRWEQSKEGLGQAVLISGEAGVGKSSLVATIRHDVVQEGYTRMTFRCSPYYTNSALYPVIEHVQHVLQFQPGEPPATKLDKLEHVLSGYSRPLNEVVPLVAALLSVPVPEGRYAALNLTPQQQRQQIQDTLVGWLLEEAERQPTLALWEDLHWADPSTLEMLGLVLEQTPTVPMLHVLTFRPEFEPPWPTRSHMTPITLNRLERPQVEALIIHLADNKALPAEVVQHIVAKTDGVPLYVEELSKMLLESDLMRQEGDRYVLTGPLLTVAIPDTLQDSLMARLDQLNTAKEVAQLGSVLGREFAYELIQAISPQDDDTLQDGLAQLIEAELLYQRGRPPRARYLFKHALIQDAAYASLLRSTRQQVHQQVARLLEARFPHVVETEPELLAHHFEQGELAAPALDNWLKAGRRAVTHSANVEAVNHLQRALALIPQLSHTDAAARRELDIQLELGVCLMATHGYAAPETERTFARARELCEAVGDTDRLLRTLYGQWANRYIRSEPSPDIARRFANLAAGIPDDGPQLVGCRMLALEELHSGNLHQALELTGTIVERYEPTRHRGLALQFGHDALVAGYTYRSWALWQLGYPDQADQSCQRAQAWADEIDHANSRGLARVWADVMIHVLQRRYEQAATSARDCIRFCQDKAIPLWAGYARVFLGWARVCGDADTDALTDITEGLDELRQTGTKRLLPLLLALAAEAQVKIGLDDDARRTITDAFEALADTRDVAWESDLLRIRGHLYQGGPAPDLEHAQADFTRAMEVAQSRDARQLELKAAVSLARTGIDIGRAPPAREILAPVYGWFTEGFDTADLKEAKSLLNELEDGR